MREKAADYEKTLLALLRDQFEVQRMKILGSLDTGAIGKSYTRKAWLDDLINWNDEIDLMAKNISPTLYQIIIENGKEAMEALGLGEGTFDPITDNILTYYDNRATKIATDVNDETEKQIRATLAKGVADGESTHELAGRVEDVMGSASTMRADRIARTETTRTQNYGSVEAWKQSGVVSGKEWFTAEDERVCPFCNDLDGKVSGLDENFFDKGDSLTVDGQEQQYNYDDIPAAPLHVNCRCTVLPVRS